MIQMSIEFKRCASLGILPRMIHHNFTGEFQEWEEAIERTYYSVKQLFWNTLSIIDKDEKRVIKYQLEEIGYSLLRQQSLLLRYKRYAVTHNFEIRIATLQALTSLFYEYSQALGVMM